MSSPVSVTTRPAEAPAAQVRRSARRRSLGRRAVGWIGLAVALLAWQLAALAANSVIFPTFTSSLAAVGELLTGPVLTNDILPSIGRVLIGFAISAVLGIVVGLLLGYVRWLGDYCSAVLNFLRAVPMPLLIPAALALFGLGTSMVVAIVVSAAVWPVLLNAFDAARRIEPLYLDAGRNCGLRGPALFIRVLLPATLPSIFAGLRVALSVSLAVLVVAEILGATSGIGYFIQSAAQTFQVQQTYAGVIILGILGWFFDTTFLFIEHRVLAWERGMTGRST